MEAIPLQAWQSPFLTVFSRIITGLCSAPVYMVLFCFIYWCVDQKKCLRLGTAVLISMYVNFLLKFLLDQPSPFVEIGGFPSGYAQNSLVMWIIIASWGKRKWHFAAAALFCLLAGFSCVYLGIYFPTGVAGGWLIGGIILCGYFLAGRRIEAMLAVRGPRAGLIVCAALSFIMILYRPSAAMLMPGGILLGLGTGYFLCGRYIGFTASGLFGRVGAAKYLTLFGRFAAGMAGTVLLYVIFGKMIAIFDNSENYQLVVFLHYTLLAIWVAAGAPWLFWFVHLAECDSIHYQDNV